MVQLQVLNKVLNTKDSSILLMNNLNDEFFSDYPNEYNFINCHLKQYGTIPDVISVLDKFPDFEIIEVNEPTSYLMAELYKDRNTRFLAKTFNQVRKLLIDGKVDEAVALYTNASDDMVKAINLESVDISMWDTSNVTSYYEIFKGCAKC